MEDLITKIITTVREDYDKFVFETITPYCLEITQAELDKKTLTRALIKDKPQHIRVVQGKDTCPSCFLDITDKITGMEDCYCVRCGQHIVRT